MSRSGTRHSCSPCFIFLALQVYAPETIQPLVATIVQFLDRRLAEMKQQPSLQPCVAYVCNVQRKQETYQAFRECLTVFGLKVQEINIEGVPQHFTYDRSRLQLLRITR